MFFYAIRCMAWARLYPDFFRNERQSKQVMLQRIDLVFQHFFRRVKLEKNPASLASDLFVDIPAEDMKPTTMTGNESR